MNPSQVIARCTALHARIEPLLFARPEDERGGSLLGTTAKVGALAGAGLYGANVVNRGVTPMLSKKNPSFLKNILARPGMAASEVGGVLAQDARAAGAGAAKIGAAAWNGIKRVFRYSSVQKRAIELAARIEFGGMSQLLIGNPLTSASEARKGKKLDAYKDAIGNQVVDTQIGGLAGAGIGAATGALAHRPISDAMRIAAGAGGRNASRMLSRMPSSRGRGAAVGAVAGALGGTVIGALHGNMSARADEIRKRYAA